MRLPDALRPFVGAREHAFVTDYDGTLAPIVDDPAKAVPLPQSIDALARLAARHWRVAIISGRPVEFLLAQVEVPGVVLIGQYGLERAVDGRIELDPRAAPFVDSVQAAADVARSQWPELLIERKGQIAFTVHWRTAPGYQPSDADLAEVAAAHGLELVPGRKACEFRPAVPVDKGTVLEQELIESGLDAAFAGDDRGDLAAFDALDRMVDQRDHGFYGVRIAVDSAEAPSELIERSDLVVNGPQGLGELLTALADEVSPRP